MTSNSLLTICDQQDIELENNSNSVKPNYTQQTDLFFLSHEEI